MRRLVLGIVIALAAMTPANAVEPSSSKAQPSAEKSLPKRMYPEGIPGIVIASLMKAWPTDWDVEETTARFTQHDHITLESANGSTMVISLEKGSTKGMIHGITIEGRVLSMIFHAVPELEKERPSFGLAAYFAHVYDLSSMRGVVFYDLNVMQEEFDGLIATLGDPGDIPSLDVEFAPDGKRIISSSGVR